MFNRKKIAQLERDLKEFKAAHEWHRMHLQQRQKIDVDRYVQLTSLLKYLFDYVIVNDSAVDDYVNKGYREIMIIDGMHIMLRDKKVAERIVV
jgi:hypothetical protein